MGTSVAAKQKVKVQSSIDAELASQIADAAKADGKTVSHYIRSVLEKHTTPPPPRRGDATPRTSNSVSGCIHQKDKPS